MNLSGTNIFEERMKLLEMYVIKKINYERLVGETGRLIKQAHKEDVYHNDFSSRLFLNYLSCLNLLERRVEIECKLIEANLSCRKSFISTCEYHLKKMSSAVEAITHFLGKDTIEKTLLWERDIGIIQIKNSPIGKLFANRHVLVEMAPQLPRGAIKSDYMSLTFNFIYQKKQLDRH